MPNVITTSLVVQFSQGESAGVLSLEVDDRSAVEGGFNGGKTSFSPGQSVVLLRYATSNVVIDAFLTSQGTLSVGGNVDVAKTEDITFAGETAATLKYPLKPGTGITYEWIGTDLGTINVVTDSQTQLELTPPADTYFAGIARVTYTSQAKKVTLSNTLITGLTEYSIVVFLAGHTP